MEGWKQREPLAPYTTFGIGGPAEYFATVRTAEELRARIKDAHEHLLPVTILGGGSNVLVSDSGVAGAVIRIEIDGITATDEGDSVLITAGAGEVFDDLVAYTVAHGYWGIENLSAIPGTVGATPVQNVGAYGIEIGEYIESVEVIDLRDFSMRTLTRDECAFGYRDSVFKHEAGESYVVTQVTIRLSQTAAPQLAYKDLAARFAESEPTQAEIREAVIDIRSKKFPNWEVTGTAGSFFKNPIIPDAQYRELLNRYPELPGFLQVDGSVKVPLGWILDKVLSLRGTRVGNVGAYEGQALVIVNYGNATAAEVEIFAANVAHNVYEDTGIKIEWEVTKL